MAGHPNHRRGFTLVEAVIVTVVIAVILAVTIPWMREREREHLQALAETEPWEVFEFRAGPAKDKFPLRDKDIFVECEIVNLTNYPLMIPQDLGFISLVSRFDKFDRYGEGNYLTVEMLKTLIVASGESVRFDLRFSTNFRSTPETRAIFSGFSEPFQSNAFQIIMEDEWQPSMK